MISTPPKSISFVVLQLRIALLVNHLYLMYLIVLYNWNPVSIQYIHCNIFTWHSIKFSILYKI